MRANILFLIGAISGVLLAATGLLEEQNQLSLSTGTVAEVNGTAISQAQYTSIVKGIAEEKKNTLQPSDYEFILQRIIDEELLVQQGYELGLLELNSVVRNEIVKAVTASIIAKNSAQTPSSTDLESFYQQHKAFFQPPTQLHIKHMKFAAKSQAEQAYSQLLKGNDFDEVKTEHAIASILNIPDTLLPVNDLVKYIGPTLMEEVSDYESGKLYPPVQQNDQWHLLAVVDKSLGEPPPLQELTQIVRNEYQRRSNEEAFKEYLIWLRKKADIQSLDSSQLEALIDS